MIQANGSGGWARSIAWIIENWFLHTEGFARDVGIHSRSVRDWLQGPALPSITSAVSLACQLNLNVSDLLMGRVDVFVKRGRGVILEPIGAEFKRKNTKHDTVQLGNLMKEAAVSLATPSLKSIGDQAGVHLSFLARKFPAEAEIIKERYQAHRQQQSVDRRIRIETAVRETISSILATGGYPGTSMMRKKLPAGVNMMDDWAKHIWQEELKARNLQKPGK